MSLCVTLCILSSHFREKYLANASIAPTEWSRIVTYSIAQRKIDANKCSTVAEMGDRLATIDMCRKLVGLCPLFGEGELGPYLTQCCLGRGLLSYQVASWSIELFCDNRYGLKIWGLCPFGGGGAMSPSNTMWPGPRPTACQVSSWSVQPFGHNTPTSQTDRQTGQDNGPIA